MSAVRLGTSDYTSVVKLRWACIFIPPSTFISLTTQLLSHPTSYNVFHLHFPRPIHSLALNPLPGGKWDESYLPLPDALLCQLGKVLSAFHFLGPRVCRIFIRLLVGLVDICVHSYSSFLLSFPPSFLLFSLPRAPPQRLAISSSSAITTSFQNSFVCRCRKRVIRGKICMLWTKSSQQ